MVESQFSRQYPRRWPVLEWGGLAAPRTFHTENRTKNLLAWFRRDPRAGKTGNQEKLQERGLLAPGDPERFQYGISALTTILKNG